MITKDMLINNIIKSYPDAVDILIDNGMPCIGCPSSQMESLEEAALVHGLDIDKLIRELNA
ncbi:DUF1858 domain-containing protein [Lagierella sp.]|uniref:DUF1858 domain-containing protein n=1 Tax=Lagierella sp. TaxID=2849657 RepID=UPI0026176950|nr:DUF1858 domain-containing protein [Lagierella sp.]